MNLRSDFHNTVFNSEFFKVEAVSWISLWVNVEESLNISILSSTKVYASACKSLFKLDFGRIYWLLVDIAGIGRRALGEIRTYPISFRAFKRFLPSLETGMVSPLLRDNWPPPACLPVRKKPGLMYWAMQEGLTI